MLNFLKNLFGNSAKISQMLSEGALILDVRTPTEYRQGHVKGSLNIPLDALNKKVEMLRKKQKPIVTCCRSGMRSGSAANMLRAAGIEAQNGGPWQKVERLREV